MIVTAMLAWYDEPPSLLRQAIRGAALFVDRIVAADGAYELVPDAAAKSPAKQKRAIQEECAKHGLELIFLRPQIWPGQVAKRDAMLQVACQDSDWVMTLDADWRITGDGKAIRAELERLHQEGCEQVLVSFIQPDNPQVPIEETCANVWHEREAGQPRLLPLIYRSFAEMRYTLSHWTLFARRENGEAVGLWGGQGHPHVADPVTAHLNAPHLFEHICLFRERKQIVRNREYISARDAAVAKVGHET